MKTSNANAGLFKISLVLMAALILQGCNKKRVVMPDPDINEVYGVIEAQKNAWNEGNLDGFLAAYEPIDSIMFVTSKRVDWGYGAIAERYKKAYDSREKMGKLDFDSLAMLPIGKKAAVVKGNWHLYRNQDTVGGVFSTIFRYRNGEWRIMYDHTN